MKRWCVKIGSYVLALLCFSGCGPQRMGQKKSIVAAGSSSAWLAATVLMEAYSLDNPGTTASYTNGGSMEGVLGVLYGVLDVAFATNTTASLPEGLEAIPFAHDGVALVVHPDNPVSSLGLEELRGIASGEIYNWRQLGGEDLPIHFVGGLVASGARYALEEALDIENVQYGAEILGEGGIRLEVENNPGALGCLTLAMAGATKVLAIDGIPLTEETLRQRQYPITVTYHIVYNTALEGRDTVMDFIAYFYRVDKQRLAAASGVLDYDSLV